MHRFLFLLWAVGTLVGLSGCGSTDPASSNTGHVSTIPWNRPEKWESQGPMGGMMQGSQ